VAAIRAPVEIQNHTLLIDLADILTIPRRARETPRRSEDSELRTAVVTDLRAQIEDLRLHILG
jgi:hypothetical protein